MSVTAEALPSPAESSRPGGAGLRRYYNLTRELAITQFKLRYTGSALGYLWSLFKPAMWFALMYFVFVGLFKVDHIKSNGPAADLYPNANEHFGIQLLLGIVLWTFFSECTAAAMQSIAGTGHLIRKAYFPRSIMVIAASLTSVLTLAINLSLVLAIAIGTGQADIGLRIVAVIPLILELYALALGVSLFLSALFVQYRDVGHLWEVVSLGLFFGSAVQYPFILLLDHGWISAVLGANPVAQIVEDMRHAIVTPNAPWHATAVGPGPGLAAFALVALTLVVGSLAFRRMSPHFAENL
jgi:ABC-2 type transport system permease protein